MRDLRNENRFNWREDERDYEHPDYGQGYTGQGYYGQQGYNPYGSGQRPFGPDYGRSDQGRWSGQRGFGSRHHGGPEDYRGGREGWRGEGWRGEGWHGNESRGTTWRGTDWRSGEAENMGQADQSTAYSGLTSDWSEPRGRFAGRGPKGYRRSDERIREDVSDRLTDDHWLDASDIEVKVESGMVTLSGSVGSRDDKRRAEDIVMSISGVKDVINQIHVDQGILEQVSDALTGGSEKRRETSVSARR